MEQHRHSQVRVYPENAAAGVHHHLRQPANFDAGGWSTQLTSDSGVQLSIATGPELAPMLDGHNERAVSARLQTFSATVYRFGFATAFSSGHLEVAGHPPAVSSTSKWGGFRLRRWLTLLTAAGGLSGAYLVSASYAAQHAWFAEYGNGPSVFLLAAISALLTAGCIATLLMARPARSATSIASFVAGAVAFAGGTWLAFVHHRPTATAANEAYARGNHQRAQLEAQALVDLNIDEVAGGRLLDLEHLRRVSSANDIFEMASSIDGRWFTPEYRDQALAMLQPKAYQVASLLFKQRNEQGLNRLEQSLKTILPHSSTAIAWLAAILASDHAIALGNVSDATDELNMIITGAADVPVELRLPHFDELLAAARRLHDLAVVPQPKSARARRQSLTTAVDVVKAFAAAEEQDPNLLSQALALRLRKTKQEIARADKKARDREGDGELMKPDLDQPETPVPAVVREKDSQPAKGDVLDPYSNN